MAAAAPQPVSAPPSAAAPNPNKRKRPNKGKKKKFARSDEPVRLGANKPSAKFLKILQERARDYNSDDEEEEEEEQDGDHHQQQEHPPHRLACLLKVRVVRGINLTYRYARGSDPYVVLRLGKKKLKTSVKKRSVNPIWHEELTLSVTNPNEPIKLEVFDKDTFSRDDPIGDAEIDVAPLLEVLHMDSEDIRNGATVSSVGPSTKNCLQTKAMFAGGTVGLCRT